MISEEKLNKILDEHQKTISKIMKEFDCSEKVANEAIFLVSEYDLRDEDMVAEIKERKLGA